MTSLLQLGATKKNADTAGFTGRAAEITEQATSTTERFSALVHTDVGELGYLFGHDSTNAVATPLDRASSAVRGVLGGLRPPGNGQPEIHPANEVPDQIPAEIGTPPTLPAYGEILSTAREESSKLFAGIRKGLGI